MRFSRATLSWILSSLLLKLCAKNLLWRERSLSSRSFTTWPGAAEHTSPNKCWHLDTLWWAFSTSWHILSLSQLEWKTTVVGAGASESEDCEDSPGQIPDLRKKIESWPMPFQQSQRLKNETSYKSGHGFSHWIPESQRVANHAIYARTLLAIETSLHTLTGLVEEAARKVLGQAQSYLILHWEMKRISASWRLCDAGLLKLSITILIMLIMCIESRVSHIMFAHLKSNICICTVTAWSWKKHKIIRIMSVAYKNAPIEPLTAEIILNNKIQKENCYWFAKSILGRKISKFPEHCK